jgi:hypothetical protein
MADELRKVIVPPGTHLAESRGSDGLQRDLLFKNGTNELVGPAESYRVGDGPTVGQQLMVVLIQELTTAAIHGVVNFVADVDWGNVHDKAGAAWKRSKSKVATRLRPSTGRAEDQQGTDVVAVEVDASSSDLDEIDPYAKNAPVTMTSAEYRERCRAVLEAEAYAAWQRGLLANAIIEDDETSLELRRGIMLVLEGRSAELDAAQADLVLEFLTGVQSAELMSTDDNGEADGTASPQQLP